MRNAVILFVAAAVCLALAPPAEAQFARAGVNGQVTDPEGSPLPGVTVTVENQETGLTRTVVTAASGAYRVTGLVPGPYRLTFRLQGFQTVERPDVRLTVGQQPTLNMSLELASVEETVTVTAQTPLVETTSKEVGGALTSNEIEELPSINRSFIMFASLLPGVVAEPGTSTISSDVIYVNGQDDTNNQFNIDGAANDDDQNGGNAGGQVRAAFEAMQEFQILTSQFDAEFGRTQGGVINAITKSGTNEFHGVGFAYFQDSNWNSTPFFVERNDLPVPEFKYKALGATLGGPILRDRTHFFASYEYLTPDEPIVHDFSGAGPDFEQFTFATSEENVSKNMMLKLDHQLTANNKMAVRFLHEHQPQDLQDDFEASRELLAAENDYDWTLVGSMDSVLSNTTFNNLRVSFTREDVYFGSRMLFDLVDDPNELGSTFEVQRSLPPMLDYPDIELGAPTRASHRINNSTQFDDTFSTYITEWGGDHDIRFGGSYYHKTVQRDVPGAANGEFDFPDTVLFDIDDPSTYPENFEVTLLAPRGLAPGQEVPANNVFGLFFQNDWQPIPSLTLNLGARYDWETFTNDNNNLAPRLGVAWDPIGDGRTTIRGGFGRFYERYIFAEFEDPIQLGIRNIGGVEADWLPADDQSAFIQAFDDSGCLDLTCLRDYLRDLMESQAEAFGFNANPEVEGTDIGLRDAPYADVFSVGVEREVIENLSLGFDFVYTDAKNQLLQVELNPFTRFDGFRRADISVLDGAVDPRINSVRMNMNTPFDAEQVNRSLQFSARKRQSMTPLGRLGGRLSYTYSQNSGNQNNDAFPDPSYFQRFTETGWDFDTNQIIGEFPDPALDHPQNTDRPVGWHRTHNFVLSGTWIVPRTSWRDNGGLVFSGVFRAISGDRFTITLSERMDNNNRAVAPADTYDPNNPNDISREDVEFSGKLNGASHPFTTNMDFSVRYRIPFRDGMYATVLVDMFNLFDTVNFLSSGGTRTTFNSFLIPRNAAQLRQFQIGVKFNY